MTTTGWSATASDGTIQSYNAAISIECNNKNLFILTRNFQKYSKTYTISDYEFYQLFIEFDIYFNKFTTTTISIQVNTQVIYEQTFTSQKLKLNNICGTGQDSQYTIYQGFYTKQQTLQLQIEYIQNVVDANSYVGIKNLNIYSNGIPLIGGCPMSAPFNLNGVCQTSCPSTQYYLGGPDLNQCIGPQNGNSMTEQILTTDDWVFQQTGSSFTNNGLYPNIMNNEKFSSQFVQGYYFIHKTFSRTLNCKLQIYFIFYIFGEWNDQSIVTLVIGNGGKHPVYIAKYNGVYQSSTQSGIYFTNLTTSAGQSIVARKTQILFQVNYYPSSIQFSIKKSIIGTGSFGFSDITFYDATTTTQVATIFDLTCPVGFYQFRGLCKSSCPAYSDTSETNRNCTDYSSIQSKIFNSNQEIDLFGFYLIKQFYQNNFEYTDIANTFTIFPPKLNNFYNGQYFSNILEKKILGGYNSWGYGAFGKTYSNLQPHVQLRIHLNLFLIDDFQSGDTFQIYIDGILACQFGQTTKLFQFQGFNSYDSLISVSHKQPHYDTKLQIIFLCNIAQKDSSKASCGISDLMVLLDQDIKVICPTTTFSYLTLDCEHETSILQCSSYQCTACSNNICSQCSSLIGYELTQVNNCDCTVGFYYDLSTQKCKSITLYQLECHYSCKTCSSSSSTNCLTCDSSRTLLEVSNPSSKTCPCNTNFHDFEPQMVCQPITSTCHQTCQTCFGIQYYQCLSCSSNLIRNLTTTQQCQCNSGYYDQAGILQCYPCHLSCATCFGGTYENCQTCKANRVLNVDRCDCITSHNDQNGTLGDCQQDHSPCHYSCNNCFGPNQNQCLDCQADNLRTYISATNTCDCPLEYNGSQSLCTLNCHNTCLTCFGPLTTNCNTCDTSIRYSINSQCYCLAGANDFLNPPICAADLTICFAPYVITCFGNLINQAITCDLSQNRIVQNNVCVCQAGYFEDSTMNFSCSLCHYSCQTCVNTSSNCQSCTIQNNRVLIDQKCHCLQNYSEVSQALCISCLNNDCLTCDILQQCLKCKQDVKHVENGICVCDDGYYQADNNCFQCDSSCLTCFGHLNTQCQSCHIDNYKQLIDSHCECIPGYQETDQKHCVDCSSLLGKPISKCQYADPFDGVWTYGEQCDDGNTNSKDGCSSFTIQPGFSCINTFDQQSICFKCQDNCVNCDFINQELLCITCQDSYFNNQKQCIQCLDSQCISCKSPSQCDICHNNIVPINGKCIIECDQGYYQVGLLCEPKCGDGFKAFDEQCDDGNNYSGDGCNSNCQLEDNYVCNTISNLSNCVFISPPILEIYPITINQQDMKRFTIKSSQNVYSSNISMGILSDQIQFVQLQYQIAVQQDQNKISPLLIDANLTFSQSFNILDVIFQINGQINNEYQQETAVRQLKVQVKNVYILQQQQKQISSQINQASQGSVSVLALTSILQLILLGSIQQFMQLLNIIQQLQYIQYVNIQFPPNFADFFIILSRFNIQTVSKFVGLSSFASIFQIDLILHVKPPLKFQRFGINAYFLANIQQFIIQCFTGLLLYQTLKFIIFLLYLVKVQFQMNACFNKRLYGKISKLQNKLIKSCWYIKKNGFIQLMLTSCYDVQFAIQLQLSIENNDDLNQSFNKILAYGFLFFYGYIMIKLNQFQDQELNQTIIWQNKLNQIKMVQAFIFILSRIISQHYITIFNYYFFVYIIANPFKDLFNNFKLIIQELCMFLTTMSFILYIYSPIQIDPIILGWFQLGLYCIMIIGNILIEAYSNAMRILKFYQQPKQQPTIQTIKRARVFFRR